MRRVVSGHFLVFMIVVAQVTFKNRKTFKCPGGRRFTGNRK